MPRLHNLDYLRGLSALGIMIYHYSIWNFGNLSAESFLGRVGIYGVSTFYVISGLTLYIVYFNNLNLEFSFLKSFWKKRAFRIFPLFWIATFLFLITDKKELDYYRLFLNFTGLFGLIRWDYYLAVGSWSIGNELVFYLFLPLFIVLGRSYKTLFFIFSLITFAIGFYFAFEVLDPRLKLTTQWHHYTNPLNQFFLFLGGFLLGYIFQDISIRPVLNLSFLFMGLLIFILWPATGDQIVLVSGFNRLVFSFSCFLISLSFFKLEISIFKIINKLLSNLGKISYSVYLLHPSIYLSFSFFNKRILHFSKINTILITAILTIVCSYYSYTYFEKYFINFAKRKR